MAALWLLVVNSNILAQRNICQSHLARWLLALVVSRKVGLLVFEGLGNSHLLIKKNTGNGKKMHANAGIAYMGA